MKHLAAFLLLLAASAAYGQTVKTLGFNTTNGHVVYSGTNALTFTNSLGFSTNAAAASRTNLGLGFAALTNTNATSFRSAIGLGDWATLSDGGALRSEDLTISDGEQADYIRFTAGSGVAFFGNRASQFRTALGLGLTALTNTNAANFRAGIGVAPAPIFKVLTNDFSITNQTNMTVVDGLTFNTEANKRYVVELLFLLRHEATSTLAQINATNATVYGNWDSFGTGGFTTNRLTNAHTFSHGAPDARAFVQTFYVEAGTNSGSVSLSAASTVATNTNTIGVGSYFMAQEVTPTP